MMGKFSSLPIFGGDFSASENEVIIIWKRVANVNRRIMEIGKDNFGIGSN